MNFAAITDYELIFDLLPVNIIILEGVNNGKDFFVTNINATTEQTENLSKADARGYHLNDLFPHLSTSTFEKSLQSVYNVKKSITLEPEVYDSNGLEKWIKSEIHPLPDNRIIVFYVDYTDQKEAEDLLIGKTELYKKLLEELSEQTKTLAHYKRTIDKYTIVLMTDVNGIVTYISEEYEHVSGYTKAEVIGKPQNIFHHPEVNDEFYREMWYILSTTGQWEGELIKRRKDGSDYWLLTHIIIEKDLRGNITGYSSIAHDITSKKKLEALSNELEQRISEEIEKNRIQTAHMMEQSRLAQMGEMLNMIAHQWRQPLASVSAIATTLGFDVMMDNYQEAFFKERLESIVELSKHLSNTIDDFRGFFKEDKQTSLFLPRQLIKQSLKIIGPTLENHQIKVSVNFEDIHQLLNYSNELKQVILNILKNAEDALLENNPEDKTIDIHTYEMEGKSCIQISDNAGGIPESIIDKIFDPYFSTKLQKDGTGLGLYMSRTIVNEHCNGELFCKNCNNGACFIIILPINT